MKMTFHNLKVAVRNLMKYKLQTIISVLSIAIGIVTLAFAHAAMSRLKLPCIYSQPYAERAYNVSLKPLEGTGNKVDSMGKDTPSLGYTIEIIRALKKDGGPKSVERMAIPSREMYGALMKFHLCDSTTRTVMMKTIFIDPDYFNLIGLRSAITGKIIKRLEPGEAVISKERASFIFGKANPIGAVYAEPCGLSPLPLTIVDVYEDLSILERPLSNQKMYYSLGEIEDGLKGHPSEYYIISKNNLILLREGCSEQELLEELNARLKPFRLSAKLEKMTDKNEVIHLIKIRTKLHLVGALILIAAIIGFLRMQVQLFWMRRREVALRITHGAKRWQLFWLLFSEIILVVGMAVVMAMLIGSWVETFLYTQFATIAANEAICIRDIPLYCLYTGGLLLLVCGLTIWIALSRICRAGQGMAANMRGSRSHMFRNVMLGIQIVISTILVCSTLTINRKTEQLFPIFHLPDNLDSFKECILLNCSQGTQRKSIDKEIELLPSLEKKITYNDYSADIPEIQDNPEILTAFGGIGSMDFICATDTSIISFYQLQVNWLHKPAYSDDAYLLLDEGLYQKLRGFGMASTDVLTQRLNPQGNLTLPIAGTIPSMPYYQRNKSIMIHPSMAKYGPMFVLLPKKGKYQSLMREAETAIQNIDTSSGEIKMRNFHEYHEDVTLVESIRTASWILCACSLIICAMAIYSTIALDTRSRRKEVAIRKVNGAKSRNIYSLFGSVYLLIVLLSFVIAIPVAASFHKMVFPGDMDSQQMLDWLDASPLIPCLAGSLIIMSMVATIVIWNIRSIMRTNPSEIIAKE